VGGAFRKVPDTGEPLPGDGVITTVTALCEMVPEGKPVPESVKFDPTVSGVAGELRLT
jgi:hypothetical protein